MDDKLAADEARRSVQHESVKAQVEGEVQSEIADQSQAPAAGELPPLLQTLLRPVRRRLAVERGAAAHLAVLVRRAARPAAGADRETSGLPIFRTPRVGLAALSLPWQCEVDKAR